MRKTAFEPCIPVDEDPWVRPAASIRDRSHARSAARGVRWHLDRVQRRWGTTPSQSRSPALILSTVPDDGTERGCRANPSKAMPEGSGTVIDVAIADVCFGAHCRLT